MSQLTHSKLNFCEVQTAWKLLALCGLVLPTAILYLSD